MFPSLNQKLSRLWNDSGGIAQLFLLFPVLLNNRHHNNNQSLKSRLREQNSLRLSKVCAPSSSMSLRNRRVNGAAASASASDLSINNSPPTIRSAISSQVVLFSRLVCCVFLSSTSVFSLNWRSVLSSTTSTLHNQKKSFLSYGKALSLTSGLLSSPLS